MALGNIEVSSKLEIEILKLYYLKESYKIQLRPIVNITGISPAAFQINL
jgi:hypothetical protein